MNRAEKTLRAFLMTPSPLFAFIRKHGRFYRPQANKLQGVQGYCYEYSQRHAGYKRGNHPNLLYCEGFALPAGVGIPVGHAWNSTGHDDALDSTWLETGLAYFGVPFSHDFIKCYRRKYRGHKNLCLINNWQDDFPLVFGGMQYTVPRSLSHGV